MLKNSLRPLFFPESNQDSMENSTDDTLLKKLGISQLIEKLQTLKSENQLSSETIQQAVE